MRCSRSFLITLVVFSCALAPRTMGGGEERVEDAIKRGTAALAARDYRQALRLFEMANKSQHKACGPCYLGLAAAYEGLHDVEQQLENASKALQYTSDALSKARAHQLKGEAFLALATQDLQKLKDAEEEFRAAAELDGSNPRIHFDLGITLLRQSRTDEGKKELNAFLASNPSGANAELARKLIANPHGGYEPFAPDFQVTTLEGENLELSKLAGKVVVLDFWATWCPSCVAGVPELQDLVKKYSRDQLVLISISGDSDGEKWRAFIAKKHMGWAQYWDRDRRISILFGIRALPTYLVIDRDGIIRHRVVGTNPRASVAFRLKPILKTLMQPNS